GVACIHQRNAAGFGKRFMSSHLIDMHVEGHIGGIQEIVGEVLLDDIALVPAADDEVINAVLGIDFQDVPEDGAATNLDHRLGPDNRLFRKPRAEPACEYYRFHPEIPSVNLLISLYR